MFLKLTTVQNKPLYINPHYLEDMRDGGKHTELRYKGANLTVVEKPEDIMNQIYTVASIVVAPRPPKKVCVLCRLSSWISSKF